MDDFPHSGFEHICFVGLLPFDTTLEFILKVEMMNRNGEDERSG